MDTILPAKRLPDFTVDNVTMVTMDRPEWYKKKDFLAYLNDPNNGLMRFHTPGTEASEWSDMLVWVDPSLSGEGDSSDMPCEYWDEICEVAGVAVNQASQPSHHIGVKIRNM
jgi:hypothetical protein